MCAQGKCAHLVKASRDVGAHEHGLLDLQLGSQLALTRATNPSVSVGVASVVAVAVLLLERFSLVQLFLQQLLRGSIYGKSDDDRVVCQNNAI